MFLMIIKFTKMIRSKMDFFFPSFLTLMNKDGGKENKKERFITPVNSSHFMILEGFNFHFSILSPLPLHALHVYILLLINMM